jgi:hypothetical protein
MQQLRPFKTGVHWLLQVSVLTSLAWATGSRLAFAQDPTCPTVVNPISKFPVIVDGAFTGFDPTKPQPQAGIEWSDVTPQAFLTDPNDPNNLLRICPGDPSTDTLVYTALAPGLQGAPLDDLYLLYDFLKMTDPNFKPGQVVATIHFPVTPSSGGPEVPISVSFVAAAPNGGYGIAISTGPVVFKAVATGDFNGNGTVEPNEINIPAGSIGIEGALGFGPSPNDPNVIHGIAELGVPLRIPANFGSAFPPAGVDPNNGLYSPDPKFWSSTFKADPNNPDPAGSSILTTINPNGTVSLDISLVPFAAQDAKQSALASLGPLATSTSIPNKRDLAELKEAIAHLTKSIDPNFYVDPGRLKPRQGERVFENEEAAVEELVELSKSKNVSAAVASTLTTNFLLLVAVDGQFAVTALNDAEAANKSKQILARAQKLLDEGNSDASAGHSLEAIEDYERAWELATESEKED